MSSSHPKKTFIVGIAGGSGSGKTELAKYLLRGLRKRALLVSHDWYYRDRVGLSDRARARLNVDHPGALETNLLVRHLGELKAHRSVNTPRYNYATRRRVAEGVIVSSADVIVVEGLFVLHEEKLRRIFDLTIFVDVPADIRLIRRIRRDALQRGIPLEATLGMYERFVRPMHERFVQPSVRHADKVWTALTDQTFPAKMLRGLREKLL